MLTQDITHAANFFLYLFGRAVALAQQNRRCIQVIAGMHKVFHCRGHGFVHHLQTRRNNALGDHGCHRVTGFSYIVKTGHDAAGKLRLRYEFDQDLGGHRQHAFAANNQTKEVVARRIQGLCAKFNRLALHRKAPDFQNIVQR